MSAGAEPVGHVRLGYARASTARQSLDAQLDSLAAAGVTRIFSEKISTRATKRPELKTVVKLAGEDPLLRRRRDPRRPRAQAARSRHQTRHARRGTEGQ
ncbi:recombinase family protein [Streptomyces sparsogenes]|uniref:recombinase family protein n=1 Tax=Streptomyces sparsogenes TaxID=67365 RepID=UPI0033CFB86A